MGNEYLVAVDLGTANVVILIGRKNEEGSIELITSSVYESRGMIRGDIKNMEQITQSLKEALQNVEDELNITICEAYVGMSGQHIKCSKHSGYVFIENTENEVKEVDVRRLNASMRNVQVPVGESIIQILPQNYLVDGDSEIREPVGVIGKKLEAMFNIVTNDKATVGRIDKCLSKLDLKCTQYVLNALASAEAVLYGDEKELGVAVIDIGAGTTDIAIFQDNIIRHVGVVPIGGNTINKDIRSAGILERHVENLKTKYGCAMAEFAPHKILSVPGLDIRAPKAISLVNLSLIIEARLKDIIECVKIELKRSGYEKTLEAGLVLTGGCSQFPNIAQLFEKETNYPVRVAKRISGITLDESSIYNDPIYATAVGILMEGVASGATTRTEAGAKPTPRIEEIPLTETESNKATEPSVQQAPLFSPAGQPMAATEPIVATPTQPSEPDDDPEINDPQDESSEAKSRPGFFSRITNNITTKFEKLFDGDDEINDEN